MRKILLALIIILSGFAGLQLWLTQGSQSALPPAAQQADVGGAFSLTDQDGKPVTDADFRGRVMLVFFGFTHCPDICPVTVASLASALEMLGEQASAVAPIFITVDPARDTPEVIKTYLGNADSRIIGLTGTEEQITQAAAAYKAYFSAPEPAEHEHGEEGGHEEPEATVDHSGFVYLMGKDGKYIRHFSYDVPAADLADAVRKVLE